MIKIAITGPWRFAIYLFFAILFIFLCYEIPREEYVLLISVYALTFGIYILILKYFEEYRLVKEIVFVSIIIRLLLLFCIPNLSDDFYRFIWDGRILSAGHNPYLFTPDQIADMQFNLEPNDRLNMNLYSLINSKGYYSVYPPVCQFIFVAAGIFSGEGYFNDIWMMRVFIILFEAGTLYFLFRILKMLKLSTANILIYACNPLIIVELTGNIHFEAGMIFFLTASFYLLIKQKYIFSALLFGLAISNKLLPLIFLPLLFRHIGVKKTLLYSALSGIIVLLSFIPFLSHDLIQHLSSSIQLYFYEFEFNASLYYFGKLLGGWNSPDVKLFLQKFLPILTLTAILFISIRYRIINYLYACLFAVLIYFLLSTTVHPWYITILLLFASITSFRFIIWWSGLIFLTYITYITPANLESFPLIAIEYLIVMGVLIYELKDRSFALKTMFTK